MCTSDSSGHFVTSGALSRVTVRPWVVVLFFKPGVPGFVSLVVLKTQAFLGCLHVTKLQSRFPFAHAPTETTSPFLVSAQRPFSLSAFCQSPSHPEGLHYSARHLRKALQFTNPLTHFLLSGSSWLLGRLHGMSISGVFYSIFQIC